MPYVGAVLMLGEWVDFKLGEYGYSIAGESSIKLSALMEQLGIADFDLSQVANVAFTDESLLSVSKDSEAGDSDWTLTSLGAFTSEEKLTVTMRDDTYYEIDVTDAQATVTVNKLQYSNDGSSFSDLTSGAVVSDATSFELNLGYTVTQGSLSAEDPSVTYQIPAEQMEKFKDGKCPTQSGKIKDGTEDAGTYTISDTGLITLTFNEAYIEKNQTGNITGEICYDFSTAVLNKEYDHEIYIPYADSLEIKYIVYRNKADMTVTKTATKHQDTETVDYSIKVASTNGTFGPVSLDDTMTNNIIDNDTVITITDQSGHTVTLKNADGQTSGYLTDNSGNRVAAKDENGNDTAVTLTLDSDGTHFQIENLPQMGRGDQYTITYSSRVSDTNYAKLNVTNRARTTSKDENKNDFSVENSAGVTFEKVPIDKSGSVDENGIATWTITIKNPTGMDLKGWRFTDNYKYSNRITEDQIVGKKITIRPAPGTNTGALVLEGDSLKDFLGSNNQYDSNMKGYYFPEGSTAPEYTFTYQTDVSQDAGDVSNQGILTPPGGGGDSDEDKVKGKGVPTELETPKKTGDGIKEGSDNGKTAVTKWTNTWHAGTDLSAGYTFFDELWDDQWFTKSQLEAVKTALQKATNLNFTMKAKRYSLYTDEQKNRDYNALEEGTWSEDDRYYRFEVTFSELIPQDTDITFSYEATAPVAGINSKDFRNATGDNYTYTTAVDQYVKGTPTIEKHDQTDGSNWNSQSSSHDYESGLLRAWVGDGSLNPWGYYEQSEKSGLVKWDIMVNLNDYKGGDLQVVENLPAGLVMEELEFRPRLTDGTDCYCLLKIHGGDAEFMRNSNTDAYRECPVNTAVEGNKYTITIPQKIVDAVANGTWEWDHYIEIFVYASLSEKDAAKWTSENGGLRHVQVLDNSVSVKWGTDGKDTAEQTQIIYQDDAAKVISKAAGTYEGNDDQKQPYTVTLNPDRRKLLAEGATSTLQFQDVMECAYNVNTQGAVTFTLCDVHFYQLNEDGTKTSLDIKYVPTGVTEITDANGGRKFTGTFTADIPDETAIEVDYKYAIASDKNSIYLSSLKNTASILGAVGRIEKVVETRDLHAEKSKVTARVVGITVTKISSKDGTVLPGAKFTLSEYDANSSAPDAQDKFTNATTYTSNASGVLERDDTEGNGTLVLSGLATNKAYKLVEDEAPEGYITDSTPIYFYIESSSGNTVDMPDGFTAWTNFHLYSTGEAVKIGNAPKPVQYELPSTGGSGTARTRLFGLTLVVLAALALAAIHKVQKETA